MQYRRFLYTFGVLLSFAYQSIAQSRDSIKKGYTIFNPTPQNKMRAMATDRPDATESAYTVDAGHFQYEADIFKTTVNKIEGIKSTETVFNYGNFKLGLTNTTDLQLLVQTYVTFNVKDKAGNILYKSSGFGDITFRIKQNLWGNNGGKTALAVMPYITFPTSKANDAVEGGIVFPFALALKNGWSMGSQVQIDLLKNTNNDRYTPSFVTSVVFGKDLNSKTGFFAESYYTYDFREEKSNLYLDGGLTFSITPNLKLDVGTNIGITKEADKIYFVGFSFRH